MTRRIYYHAGLYLALTLTASFTLACASNPATRSATTDDSNAARHASPLTPSTVPQSTPGTNPSLPTTTGLAPIPTDLHFTAADIKYLESADPDARALAIQRRRDNQAALDQVHKLNNGYTDSLKTWSIATAKKAR